MNEIGYFDRNYSFSGLRAILGFFSDNYPFLFSSLVSEQKDFFIHKLFLLSLESP